MNGKKAIGLVEFKSIAMGLVAADNMIKTANVDVIEATVLCPGKYILLISGDVGSIQSAVDRGVNDFAENVIDSFVLAKFTSEIVYIGEHMMQVRRLVEGGYELLELPLPCLLTVVKEISDPRLPTLRGKQKAKKIDIPMWGPDDIEADPSNIGLKGSPTRVVKTFHPQVSRNGKKLVARDTESINKAVDELIEFLKDRQLI
ncbi:BMC domain-containing protein [Mahella sp.]|uniref:BMC domain-containing protein n=1 Tax=Mahella sp. TaxID=2798721 RepID=UPI0025BC2E85|nr:BMC domain-containing protein [Mahella sp.]MBZ4666563.1 Electron transfer flavoprotein alpha/beta-subunit [Mahella sp.]